MRWMHGHPEYDTTGKPSKFLSAHIYRQVTIKTKEISLNYKEEEEEEEEEEDDDENHNVN